MFKSISNWWNKDKIALQAELTKANQVFHTTQTNLLNLQEELAQAKVQIGISKSVAMNANALLSEVSQELDALKVEHRDMKEEGILDPWFIIEVNGENALKGLKINVDWNEAMVQHMKDKGHSYKNEDLMMQHFVAQLYEHVIMTLDAKVLEESDIIGKGEFE
jgi:hypothetical protein